jgi:hypothetical protein
MEVWEENLHLLIGEGRLTDGQEVFNILLEFTADSEP